MLTALNGARPEKVKRESAQTEHQDNTDRTKVERSFNGDKHSLCAVLIISKGDSTTLTAIALSMFATSVFKADIAFLHFICWKRQVSMGAFLLNLRLQHRS